ncbi:BZ3500_MvSof-1268-A1-R1_Chr5-3g08337 [Microbotryum saponariae]|uniref:Ribosome assembly factor mrt4 n=1 Tax=Microbotryum saponariae TaxID=289078 RepID=A0A2X0MD61_9BASI|nr:BZ3500_MvSof-1268-A1-R1_Chr5-3g08337 [Microbotryum saponariae]SDA08445.1 BZ3501_MvSof-1269-A2-R1_Chr5-3g08065 [Microbotryum saponariae]
MPRSKRNTTVALTQTNKKDKAHKGQLIQTIRDCCEQFQYVWVFDVEHMRNNLLQEVRTAWKGSRIFLGRNAVMRKALGATPEDECRLGVSKVANLLEGSRGLLFTNEPADVVEEWFESFQKQDFARSGNVVDEAFTLPAGPLKIDDQPLAHSLEPQLRKLGLSTTLNRGVPTLANEHVVCKKGDALNANQVNLLKLFGRCLATFQIVPRLGVNVHDGSIVGSKAE